MGMSLRAILALRKDAEGQRDTLCVLAALRETWGWWVFGD